MMILLADIAAPTNIDALVGTAAGMSVLVILAVLWKFIAEPSIERSREHDIKRLDKSVAIEVEQTKQTENLKSLGSELAGLIKHAKDDA